MRRVRIALCITELEVGGAEKAFVDLATSVDRRRFDPVAYCLGPEPSPRGEFLIDQLRRSQVPVRCLGARHLWEAPGTLRRLTRLLAGQRPDLLQSFLFHANLIGRLAARRAGCPRVLSGIRVAEPRRWHRWADRVTGHLVDRYVCVSHDVARFCRDKSGLAAQKLVVIPNGVDAGRFERARPADLTAYGLPRGARAVTYIGRLDHQKGVDWLLAAAPLWLDQLPHYHLLLVGRGGKRGSLEEFARRIGVARRVHFAGWRPEVPEILAASSLVVLPSRWEGMPNVLLEAMAGARPVVASDVEGVRELLGPLASDQVVPFGDSQALARRILDLARHPEAASVIGRQNRRRAAQEFSREATVDAYQELWTSLAPPAGRDPA